jgi:two-component system chemotaxis response regulator CheB
LPTHDIIVIGGSAGAFGGLKRILQSLPPGLPAAIFVVIHTAADSTGILPALLSKAGPLRAFAAADGTPIRLGAIFVAPPDHHLLVQPEKMRVTRTSRESLPACGRSLIQDRRGFVRTARDRSAPVGRTG